MGIRISGLNKFVNNVNAEVRKIEKVNKRAMFNAVNLIRRSTETKAPKVPIDTGNLRNSWTAAVVPGTSLSTIKMRFGYTANYAFFVHEAIGENIKWKRPGSGPKWLERALERERDAIVNEMVETIREDTIL